MSTFTIYNKFLENWARGTVDFDTLAFKVLLTTSSYTPDEDAHDFRDDVTNEVSGTGYTAGGASTTVTVTRDDANNRVDVAFGAVSWPTSTLVARRAVIYQARGGASSADELVLCIDFGSDVSSVANTFSLSATTLRLQKT